MAWIELHQTLPTHRKTKKLKRLLKIKTPQAVGHVVMLWLWSIDNAPKGDLSQVDPEDIAEACEWPKDAKVFVKAMQEAELIDADMQLHDWGIYAGRLMEQQDERRRKDRERQARYRARKAEEAHTDKVVSHDNVTRDKGVSHADITALPNLTIPDQLYNTPPHAHAHACEDPQGEEDTTQPSEATLAAAAAGREEPDPRVDPGLAKVMTFYMNRINPTPSQTSIEELAAFIKDIDPEVIIRAMEYAIDEHKAMWSYIKATLQAYRSRGIKTMADLQRANDEHDRAKQRREDTRNAGSKRTQGRPGGTPPADADPIRGFHTEE